MIEIRPVSDLRNKFTEIESTVNRGQPVYLTKNGYGTMVVMSLEHYSQIVNPVELALDEADEIAKSDKRRKTHDEVFGNIRNYINEKN